MMRILGFLGQIAASLCQSRLAQSAVLYGIAGLGMTNVLVASSPHALAQAGPEARSGVFEGAAPENYELGPEDVLEISVWKEADLRKELLVRPDGGISFPLVGDLRAAGKTVAQLRAEIKARLEKYIPDAIVSVSVLKIASQRIYVLGKVNKPGEFTVGRYVDVLQALAMAGGLTPFAAEREIRVIRKVDGVEQVLRFDYAKAQKGEGLGQNIRLQAGDTVLVP